jgi:2-hydroxychromene-2-carboxylate isomerase
MLTASDPARGSRAPLFFYFDFTSPHAYLAWCEIHSLAARHLRIVVPVPVRLTELRRASGQRPLVEIPARQRYLLKHALRLAHEMGRLVVVPAGSPPKVPLELNLALSLASLELPGPEAPALRKVLIDRLFAVAWAGAGSGRTRAELRGLLDELGLPAERLLAQAADQAAPLRAETEQAAADGVFDVPTVRVDDEVFFGVESLPHVERFLSGRDPLALEPLGSSPQLQRHEGGRELATHARSGS